MIKQSIDGDIKAAMLSGDKERVNILRTVKSVILDAEVNSGKRTEGLSEEETIVLLQKEVKKRNDASALYRDAGDSVRADKEAAEVKIIQNYLPAMMSEEDIKAIVQGVIADTPDVSMQKMGQIVGAVKSKTGPQADGAVIAALVKAELSK